MQPHISSSVELSTSNAFSDPGSMSPLIRKLESLAPLTQADRVLLQGISANVRAVDAGTDIIREGEAPDGVYLVLKGIACRYKRRNNGARQIMAYLVPGDICDLDVALLREMDHSLCTLSACDIVRVELATVLDLTCHHPSIAHALRLATLVDEATLREWLVNVGRRSATERVAHLFCELLLRLQAVGLATDDGYELPLTPADLADTTGLTIVHVNRCLATLRRLKLVDLVGQQLRITDLDGLKALAEFKANYLHLTSCAA